MAGRRCRCRTPQALGMRGRLELASPIIGFTFRADTDLVPVRFMMDPDKLATQGPAASTGAPPEAARLAGAARAAPTGWARPGGGGRRPQRSGATRQSAPHTVATARSWGDRERRGRTGEVVA